MPNACHRDAQPPNGLDNSISVPFIVDHILELHLGGAASMSTATAINFRMIRFNIITALAVIEVKVAAWRTKKKLYL